MGGFGKQRFLFFRPQSGPIQFCGNAPNRLQFGATEHNMSLVDEKRVLDREAEIAAKLKKFDQFSWTAKM